MPLFAMILATAVAAPHTSMPRYAAFGHSRTWALVDLRTGAYEWLLLPPGLLPRDLTVSNDGATVVLTNYSNESATYLLYSWDKSPAHSPHSIGDTRGYHADPAFDSAGEWIYFAHNPNAGGLPMSHGTRAYAQIYKVRVDGTGLTALTDEQGCHFAPTPLVGGGLLLLHTKCHGFERALTRMNPAAKTASVIRTLGEANELGISDDGKRAMVAIDLHGHTGILSLDIDSAKSEVLGLGLSGSKAEPRFGSDGAAFYVMNNVVWRMRAGNKSQIVSLAAGPR
jgi:hypothetical protein